MQEENYQGCLSVRCNTHPRISLSVKTDDGICVAACLSSYPTISVSCTNKELSVRSIMSGIQPEVFANLFEIPEYSVKASCISHIPIVFCGLEEQVYSVSASVSKIKVICRPVCPISYLCISPKMVWLTPDMLSSATFDIYSNANWVIF